MAYEWLRRRSVKAPLFGLAMAGFALPALAQTPIPTNGAPGTGGVQSGASGLGASSAVSTPLAAPTVSSEPPLPGFDQSLFPNMFGVRPWLTDHGIAVILDTVNEFAGTVSGTGGPAPLNLQTGGGATLDGQYGFETDINWEKLAGLTGFSTHTIIVGRYGGKPANNLIGDNLNQEQEIYGAGGNVVVHLVQAFGEETLGGGKFDVTFGRIPLDDFYMASPLYCAYESNSLCGNPKGLVDNYSHSSYPDAGWAFNVTVRPLADYYIQSGIFFSETNIYNTALDRTGFEFNSNYISGEAFPVEVGWEPAFGAQHMPGHYKLGFIYDNNNHPDNYFDANGGSFALSGLSPRIDHGSTSAYALFDQMVIRNGPGPSDGLVILGGFDHNDPSNNSGIYQDETFIGAQDLDFWKARPLDQINALFNYQTISGYANRTQAIQLTEGLPVSQIYNGASGLQTWTMNFELNYAVHVYRGVTFAPVFQYYIRPNGQTNLPDAAFLGFKSHIVFF